MSNTFQKIYTWYSQFDTLMFWLSFLGILIAVVMLTIGALQTWEAKISRDRYNAQAAYGPTCDVDATKFISDVNALRGSKNLQPVVESVVLGTVAKQRAQDMVTYRYFGHKNPSNGTDAGIFLASIQTPIQHWGEVIDGPLNSDQAFGDFKNSPEHNSILSNQDIRYIGVASLYEPDAVHSYDENGKVIGNSTGDHYCIVVSEVGY